MKVSATGGVIHRMGSNGEGPKLRATARDRIDGRAPIIGMQHPAPPSVVTRITAGLIKLTRSVQR